MIHNFYSFTPFRVIVQYWLYSLCCTTQLQIFFVHSSLYLLILKAAEYPELLLWCILVLISTLTSFFSIGKHPFLNTIIIISNDKYYQTWTLVFWFPKEFNQPPKQTVLPQVWHCRGASNLYMIYPLSEEEQNWNESFNVCQGPTYEQILF